MGAKDIVPPQTVTIELGGKEWVIRYPVRAFRELQERHGGWRAAWNKMANLGEAATVKNDLNYDVLIDFLEIGIHNAEAPMTKIREWVDDLMQDEVDVIIRAINKSKTKWAPVAKKKEAGDEDPQE